MLMFRCAAVAVLLSLSTLAAGAENWPNWRGPRGDGSSTETNIPTQWSGEENVAWKVRIPGTGHSSPIVWDDRVFVTSCLIDEAEANAQAGKNAGKKADPKAAPVAESKPVERLLICLDRKSGKTLWTQTVLTSNLEKKHHLNSFASSTPATDGKIVYVSFLESDSPDPTKNHGNMTVAAYDLEGKLQWMVKPGVFSSTHGFCSSPVIFEDKLIVNGDHDGDSYIVALNRFDGKLVWKVSRENKTRSYVTPLIRNLAGKTQMVLSGSKSVTSYNPQNGELIWSMRGPTEQFVASMVDNGEMLFLTAGFPQHHILAIKPDGSGDVTDTHIAWRTTQNCSYVPSPIIVGDYFLVVADNGIASCYIAKTGERVWKDPSKPADDLTNGARRLGRRYSASLVSTGGLAYFLSDDGLCTVIKPGREFQVVAENNLGEATYASPAISHGQLFLRGEKHLFCIGK